MTAYNRLDTLKKTLDSLSGCDGIKNRPIMIYIDGGKNEEDRERVFDVRRFVLTSVIPKYGLPITCSKKHLGLRGNSLLAINESLKKYDKIILIQDDMQFSKSFLNWMDYALNRYEDRKDIMFASGYSHINYKSSYLSPLIADGLGIWRKKYEDPTYLFSKVSNYQKQIYKDFAKHTTQSFASNLRNILKGKSDAFMALLCYVMYLRNARCIHPGINKLRYLVSDSTNCKKSDSKKLNNVLYDEFDLDESNMAYDLIKETKCYKWNLMKRFTRWLKNNLNSLL